jgi:ATP-dependent exoDNAse (exonuclease V) beta subunit
LPGLGARVCDIPPTERVHELEFLFPERYGAAAPADGRREDGFFTGFIDLVFRKDGLYYLLDWKTNELESYEAAAIARAMEEHGYFLQFRLYLQALGRWLGRSHGPGFRSALHCGGVYYLFLRGMTPDSPPDKATGVFFHRPIAGDFVLHRPNTSAGVAGVDANQNRL